MCLYWFSKLLLSKSMLSPACGFQSCLPNTGQFLCACLGDLAQLLSFLMSFPSAKANTGVTGLHHANTMAHCLLSFVEDIFAKLACGPGLYVERNLHSFEFFIINKFFPLTPVVYCNVSLRSAMCTWVTLFYKQSTDHDALMYSVSHTFSQNTDLGKNT